MYPTPLMIKCQTIRNCQCEKDNQYFVDGYLHFAKDYHLHPAPHRGDKTAVHEMAKRSAAIKIYIQSFSPGYLIAIKVQKSNQ